MSAFRNVRAFRTLLVLIGFASFILLVIVGLGASVCLEIATELRYHSKYGDQWQVTYEQDHGPLSKARTTTTFVALTTAALIYLVVRLYRLMRPDKYPRHRSRSHEYSNGSNIERMVRWRRNAFLGNIFGVLGIALGIFCVVFRLGIFADHANEIVLGMFIFLGGYSTVIWACAGWCKAKGWHDAVVFIGLMPLAVLFIPYVRIIFIASGLMTLGMIMMPIILIAVVWVLPDKSGWSRRRRTGIRDWLRNHK